MTTVFSVYLRHFPASENIQIVGDIVCRRCLLTPLHQCSMFSQNTAYLSGLLRQMYEFVFEIEGRPQPIFSKTNCPGRFQVAKSDRAPINFQPGFSLNQEWPNIAKILLPFSIFNSLSKFALLFFFKSETKRKRKWWGSIKKLDIRSIAGVKS